MINAVLRLVLFESIFAVTENETHTLLVANAALLKIKLAHFQIMSFPNHQIITSSHPILLHHLPEFRSFTNSVPAAVVTEYEPMPESFFQ